MSRKREYKKGEKVGNFRLCKYLGGGGNGEVWKVQHEFEGKSFSALKILHSRFHTDKKRYDRFCIEAKTQKRMAEEGEKGLCRYWVFTYLILHANLTLHGFVLQ